MPIKLEDVRLTILERGESLRRHAEGRWLIGIGLILSDSLACFKLQVEFE